MLVQQNAQNQVVVKTKIWPCFFVLNRCWNGISHWGRNVSCGSSKSRCWRKFLPPS